MNTDLCILILVAGFVALSAAVPSTVLKFKPQQQEDDSVEEILKILSKPEPLSRDYSMHFISKWKIDPSKQLRGFKWTDCGGSSSKIIFHDISVTPDPIDLPGLIKVAFNIEVKENIPGSLSAAVELEKKIGPIDIPIPCIDNVGSCHYKDVCSLLSQIQKCPTILTKHNISCQCPVKKGDYLFPTTVFNIPEDPVPGGDYSLKVELSYKEKRIGCLKLDASFKSA